MNGAKWHPFHIACISGNIDDAKKQLTRGGRALVDICDANGFTAIHFAVLSGSEEMVRLIASQKPNINAKCCVKGSTALMMATAKEQIDNVRILLDHGADVSISRDEDGYTALHIAASLNLNDITKRLLDYAPDALEVLDNSGANPISLAIEKESQLFLNAVTSLLPEYDQIIKLKLSRKSDKHSSESRLLPETVLHRSVSISNTPGRRLLEAARNGDCDAISTILEEAPNEVNYRGNNGRTALMEAAETGHHLAVALLILRGADTEVRTKKHLTALQLAVREGYVQATRALLEGGADENVVTRDGKTIEEICVYHGHDALLAWLQGRHVKRRTPTPPSASSPPTSQPLLADWLKHVGLQRYSTVLAANGFDTLASLDVIQDQDLETMGFLLGHKRIFLKEFNVLRRTHRQLLQRDAMPLPTTPTAETTTPTPSSTTKKRSRRRKRNSGQNRSSISSDTEYSNESTASTTPNNTYAAADMLMRPHMTTSLTSSTLSGEDACRDSTSSVGVKEICFEEVVQGRVIGEGSFGTVKEGVWRGMRVALKELKMESHTTPEMANQQLNELKREATTMARVCNHAHIIQFVGIVLAPKPCVVTVFCSNGSVETMLVNRKHVPFDLDCLSRMALEAALGVQHLHLEGVIHRDLAARNLLIDDTYHVRVADFGFARAKEHAASKGYTRSDMGPIRWSAPEAMRKKMYSEASDVFSFGVVLFEIFQREMPWSGVETIDVLFRVCSGEQMSIDESTVPPPLVELMRQCWDTTPINRPTICEVINAINIFRESQGYASYQTGFYDDSSEVSFSQSQESIRIYDNVMPS